MQDRSGDKQRGQGATRPIFHDSPSWGSEPPLPELTHSSRPAQISWEGHMTSLQTSPIQDPTIFQDHYIGVHKLVRDKLYPKHDNSLHLLSEFSSSSKCRVLMADQRTVAAQCVRPKPLVLTGHVYTKLSLSCSTLSPAL